jgi:regulator of replication initiation timing
MVHFAKELNKSRPAVEKYISGAFHTVPSDVLDALSKMGYNTEWLLHKAGKMKADQSDKMSFTETTLLRTEIANLRQQLNLTNARLAGADREIKDLRKEINEIKSSLKITL